MPKENLLLINLFAIVGVHKQAIDATTYSAVWSPTNGKEAQHTL